MGQPSKKAYDFSGQYVDSEFAEKAYVSPAQCKEIKQLWQLLQNNGIVNFQDLRLSVRYIII